MPAIDATSDWKITLAHDVLGLRRIVANLVASIPKQRGSGLLSVLLVLGLVLLFVPLWVGLTLGIATVTVYGLFAGLAQLAGTTLALILALLALLASLVGGGYLLGVLILRGVAQSADGQQVRWGRVRHLVGRLRFWVAILSLVPLGPIAYALVALGELTPAAFTGSTLDTAAWRMFFLDQVLNGALLGLPGTIGHLTDIEPVAWYASLLILLYKAILLNGFFWLVFGAFNWILKPQEERFTGTVDELAGELRLLMNDLPEMYRLRFPVDVPSQAVLVVEDAGKDDDFTVRVECLGTYQPAPGDHVEFYRDVAQQLRTHLKTK